MIVLLRFLQSVLMIASMTKWNDKSWKTFNNWIKPYSFQLSLKQYSKENHNILRFILSWNIQETVTQSQSSLVYELERLLDQILWYSDSK